MPVCGFGVFEWGPDRWCVTCWYSDHGCHNRARIWNYLGNSRFHWQDTEWVSYDLKLVLWVRLCWLVQLWQQIMRWQQKTSFERAEGQVWVSCWTWTQGASVGLCGARTRAEMAADAAPGIKYLWSKGGQVPWTILDWEGFTCWSDGARRLVVNQWGVIG